MSPSKPRFRNIKITIEYDGTGFSGWQIQPNKRTVQGEITKVLERIYKKRIVPLGAGRTDTGVHAHGQVASFKAMNVLPAEKLKKALNGNLPKDIAIANVEFVKPRFHAQQSAKSKLYRYTVLNRDARSAQQRNFSMIYPYPINFVLLRKEAKGLVGKMDFKSFQSASRLENQPKTSVRKISKLDIKRSGDFITFDIEADGFLYRMVRNIVGTLLEVGSGKLPKGSIKRILAEKNRTLASAPAKAQGLSLMEVKY